MHLRTNATAKLLQSLVDEIGRGVGLISAIDDLTYRRPGNNSGSVGAQFRHILDFVTSVLKGMENGRIDYNDRERDLRVETHRRYALERFEGTIRKLISVKPEMLHKAVCIRSEAGTGLWMPSCVAREIEFVHSHTVHHHALIAEKLAGFGYRTEKNFGVAPSTIDHWEKSAA
jgi:hypothetical protein